MKTLSALERLLRGHPQRLRCSFCGRDANCVARLVAGASAHICDLCVSKCVAILEQHGGFLAPRTPQNELIETS